MLLKKMVTLRWRMNQNFELKEEHIIMQLAVPLIFLETSVSVSYKEEQKIFYFV